MKIELGDTVKDKITGFRGVVTGRCEYISGCHQVLVVPPVKADGAYGDAQWLDEDRAEVQTAVERVVLTVTNSGPDKPAPKR